MTTDDPKQPSSQQLSDQKGTNDVKKKLESLRQHIDTIDRQIVALLSKRQDQVEQIVAIKKKHNIPVYHPAREENLISQLRNQGRDAGLDPDYVEELYRRIIRQSRMEPPSDP